MKVAILSLIAGACLVAVCADARQGVMEREGHYFENRPRLGHFRDQPFEKLYEGYAFTYERPNHPEWNDDDYRNYLPSGDQCVIYLQAFRGTHYEIVDLAEFVKLDACLGYLFGETGTKYHEVDMERSELLRENLQMLKDDAQLKLMYEQTGVEKLPRAAQSCIANMLYNTIMLRQEFPNDHCNNHYLQVFAEFGNCHTEIPEQMFVGDTYILPLIGTLKKQTRDCFENEIGKFNQATRAAYASDWVDRSRTKLSGFLFSQDKQVHNRMLPKPIAHVLRVVQNNAPKNVQINYHYIAGLLRGISQERANVNDPSNRYIPKFLKSLSDYADKMIKVNKKKDTLQESMNSYKNLVDSMCNYFRSSTSDKKYDFMVALVRMLRIVEHESLFGIGQAEFVNRVLNQAHETAPLYLSMYSCIVMGYTQGAYKKVQHNTAEKYNVWFTEQIKDIAMWPDAGFF